jgi:hydroxymethyl cephem carbamoyltransferase
VYRGPKLLRDADPVQSGWTRRRFDAPALSASIDRGAIVAWLQGRCEIGPRALGNRSLLASAADPNSHARLNNVKQREPYRPIAPVCLEEDLCSWFDEDRPDPYMLYFRRVRDRSRIPAVTHADGSARVQSVTRPANPRLHELLLAHRERTGVGVLCNTSLNFNGTGFINRVSDLLVYCARRRVGSMVIDDDWYVAPA